VPCLAYPQKNCSTADTFSVIMCPPLACPFVDTRVNVTDPESDEIMTFAAGSPILKTDPFSACLLPLPCVSVTGCRSCNLHGNATSPAGSSISITELYYAWVLKAREFLNSYRIAWCLMCQSKIFQNLGRFPDTHTIMIQRGDGS